MDGKILEDRELHIYHITVAVDIVLSVATFFAALQFRNFFFEDNFLITKDYLFLSLIIIVVWFVLLKSKNFEKFHRTKSYTAILVEYAKGVSIGAAILSVAIFFFKLDISRGIIFMFAPLNLVVLYLSRIIFYEMMKSFRGRGVNRKNILIIGDNTSITLIKKILRHKEWGFNIVQLISSSDSLKNQFGKQFSVKSESDVDIHKMLESDIIDEVIYCKNNIDQKELHRIIYSCEEVGVVFRMHSNLWNLGGQKYHLSYFEEMPFFTFMNKPSDYFALLMKSWIDHIAAAIMLLILSPLFLFISGLIKFSSKGPVYFKQTRVGLHGRKFEIMKFRTMVPNAEALKEKIMGANEMDGPVFKIKSDPRITKVGHFLRKTGLDELPQLINIIKGEMSFIGPRPPIQSEVDQYERWQLRRLSMKPGITCIWQTMPNRNSISFQKWMELDLQYIDTWSLKNDVLLFFKTFKTVFFASGQ